jgi:hypothetical protein
MAAGNRQGDGPGGQWNRTGRGGAGRMGRKWFLHNALMLFRILFDNCAVDYILKLVLEVK